MVTQPDVDGGVWVHVAVGPRSLSATACLAIVRYYIVAKMDGETMQLHINGELEGITRVYGGMRVPPRSVDGDVTVGRVEPGRGERGVVELVRALLPEGIQGRSPQSCPVTH